jgi:WD40 repeat protein
MDAATGKEISHLKHEEWVSAVAFSPNGQWVATASGDQTARVMEAATGRELARWGHLSPVDAIAVSPNGKWVATGSRDSALVAEAPIQAQVFRLEDGMSPVAFNMNGKTIAAATQDKHMVVIDTETGNTVRLDTPPDVNGIALSADGRRLATAHGDSRDHYREAGGDAIIADSENGSLLARIHQSDPAFAVAFSPDGRWMASGAGDTFRGEILVSDAQTSKKAWLQTYEGLGANVQSIEFSNNGKWLAIGGNVVDLRDSAYGKAMGTFNTEFLVRALTFSRNDRRLAVVLDDPANDKSYLGVLDTATMKQVSRLEHRRGLETVAFSPDGKRVVTGGLDKTALVVDAATGEVLLQIDLPGPIRAVRFSEDASRLEMAHVDSTGAGLVFARYPIEPQELIREACGKVTRNLTISEWKQYVGPEIPYERTCESLPFPADYKKGR